MHPITGFLCLFFYTTTNVMADITTDGSVGIKANIAASNGEYAITQDLGTQSGGNLFHSFQNFDVELNNTAVFTGSSNVTNIIARVTGGNASTINGAISSEIEGANFWLLNPNGVIVGEGASFDITGSVNLTTADYLLFEDGASFNALVTQDTSIIATTEPKAFGFLADNSSAIIFDRATLSLQDNKLVLVSRSVTFSGSKIALSNGELNVVALNTDIPIDISQLDTMEFNSEDYADVNLINTAIEITDDSESSVTIKARKLELVDSEISNFKVDVLNADAMINVDIIAMTQSTIQSSVSLIPSFNTDLAIDTELAVDLPAVLPIETIPTETVPIEAVDSIVLENTNDSSPNMGWVSINTIEAGVTESKSKLLHLSNEPCRNLTNDSTFTIRAKNTMMIDPLSFNPGEHYFRLDAADKSISNTFSTPVFTGCHS